MFGKISDLYYTSRLSTQNGEICLQKYPPISVEVSITNYLKQNVIDYQCHLTTENKFKVGKMQLFRKKAQLSHPPKTHGYEHRCRQGGKGAISPKFLAFLVILCFERRCRKQNTVARLKTKDLPAPYLWVGYVTRYA